MTNAFDTLRKILENESSRGYDNKAIIGGLDKYIPALEQRARDADADSALVDEVIAWLRQYPRLAPQQRPQAVKALLARLIAAAEPAQPPERAPASPPPSGNGAAQPAQPSDSGPAAPAPTAEPARPPEVEPRPAPPPKTPSPRPARPRPPPAGPAARPPLPPEPPGLGLDAPLTVLNGIGPKQAGKLQRLGLRTMQDALRHYPRRYVDYSRLKQINRLEFGEEVTIIATVWETHVRRIRGGQSQLVQTILSDGTGNIEATWFNQPWLRDKLVAGRQVQVSGRVEAYLGRLVLRSPEWEMLDRQALHTGRIVPIYALTQGIGANSMRRWMYEAVGYTAPRAADPLPEDIRARNRLMSYSDALLQIHFPDSQERLAAARRRLAFDEMLLMQLGLRRQRADWQAAPGLSLAVADDRFQALLDSLPYSLTGAQGRALAEVRADLDRPVPMNRLLQGDVGSGKTVVAALAMAIATQAGAQAALMVPTAILAEQHYGTLSTLLASGSGSPPRMALLLGGTPDSEKRAIHDGLRDGSIAMVIGTHALIQEQVEFANLGLVIVDEQHRFGVAQRARLRGKGGNPHLLAMSATPIPRSLALTLYGDLDVSILDELPPGRLPIETRIIYVSERERAYTFTRAQVQHGRQGFIICPLVEESDKIEAKAAVEEHERLQQHVFPDLRLGLLHGRMRVDEKEAVMSAFRDGQLDILVSTSVVEVGVDLPNASVVLVEGASRFGLAQLHQFRGRVGRGQHRSYCLLVSDEGAGEEGDTRLKDMEQTQDGFVLAEKDLERRGPGEFLGMRQAGYGDLRLAGLTDLPLIQLARAEAAALFTADPDLAQPEHRLLAERLSAFWSAGPGPGDVS